MPRKFFGHVLRAPLLIFNKKKNTLKISLKKNYCNRILRGMERTEDKKGEKKKIKGKRKKTKVNIFSGFGNRWWTFGVFEGDFLIRNAGLTV